MEELPFIDEHSTDIAADRAAVWDAALYAFGGSRPGSTTWATGARMLGCDPAEQIGWDSPAVGSSVPGFRVVELDEPRLLVLAGRHRFARYAIVLRIDEVSGGARCKLESRATFPGLHGRLYRAAVIGTRGHVVGVRRILRSIRRAAESSTD
jgi:hypothetical protein